MNININDNGVVYYTEHERMIERLGLLETVEILEASRWVQMKEEWTTAYKWPAVRLYYK